MHVCTHYNMERSASNSSRFLAGFSSAILSSTAVVLLYSSLAYAQTAPTGLTSLPSAEQVIQRVQDPYLGSIPQGKATGEVIDLTVQDALERGLKYNLGLYFSERATEQIRAERIRSLANLMPVVNGAVTEEIQKINLKAFGFNFPGFPSSVGPFGLMELQASGSWTPLNL